jgi:hypothetical protein
MTIPGPSVAEPPAKTIILAPVFGYVVYTIINNPTATLNAMPVHLNSLLSFATGQGSLCRFSKMPVNWNSHCWMGMLGGHGLAGFRSSIDGGRCNCGCAVLASRGHIAFLGLNLNVHAMTGGEVESMSLASAAYLCG